MEMLKPGTRSAIVIRVTSMQAWELPTHWMDKTLLCGASTSDRCPICVIARPRLKLYCVGQTKGPDGYGEPLLCEVGHEVLLQLKERGFNPRNSLGFCWRQERRADRPGWRVVDCAKQDCDHVGSSFLPTCLETLFGLQLTVLHDTDESVGFSRDEWFRLHRAQILARAAWHCRNGIPETN